MEIQNLFGEEITFLGYMPGAALREAVRGDFGLDVGFDNMGASGHKYEALVDVLVSRGYLKILMNPHLEVVNGQTASIVTSEHVPLDTISEIYPTGSTRTSTRYHDVLDKLQITPRVFADGYIGIKTTALIGSKATPEGVAQNSIITTRNIDIGENRIRSGESLVIGGIRKTEQRSVVRGVPFLKDIPIIGVLFSSKDFEERGKEVLFIITPTISTGGIPNEEMVAEIQKKHTPVRNKDWTDAIYDPLGSNAYTDLVEEEATAAEVRRIKAELQKTHAQREAKELQQQLTEAMQKVEVEKTRATQAEEQTKAALTAVEAEKAKTAAAVADTSKAAADAKTLAEKAAAATAAANKAAAEAAAAKATAEKAKKDAEAEIENWMKKAEEKNKEKPPAQD